MDELIGRLDNWLMFLSLAAGFYYLVWKKRIRPALSSTAPVLRDACSDLWGLTVGLLFGLRDLALGIVRQIVWIEGAREATDQRDRRPSVARHRGQPRPIRVARGRFAGSLPQVANEGNDVTSAGNDVAPIVTASESLVAPSLRVTSLPDIVTETAVIAARLAQGMSPSDVAKSLPGYSPKRNYKEYTARVREVKEALDRAAAAAEVAVAGEGATDAVSIRP